jgi:hypothetical protein
MGGICMVYIYGMTKTTVYLPRELKRALGRTARQRGCSEAALLREAVARITGDADRPPTLPLFRSAGPSIAEDIDAALDGFGRQ